MKLNFRLTFSFNFSPIAWTNDIISFFYWNVSVSDFGLDRKFETAILLTSFLFSCLQNAVVSSLFSDFLMTCYYLWTVTTTKQQQQTKDKVCTCITTANFQTNKTINLDCLLYQAHNLYLIKNIMLYNSNLTFSNFLSKLWVKLTNKTALFTFYNKF